MATVAQLQNWISEAEAKRHEVAMGVVVELQRQDRRSRVQILTVAQLDAYISVLRRELAQAEAVAGGGQRRRGIGLAWRN